MGNTDTTENDARTGTEARTAASLSTLSEVVGVVRQALADARRGRDMSVYGLYTRWQHTIVKLLPQKLTMKLWLHSTQRYR